MPLPELEYLLHSFLDFDDLGILKMLCRRYNALINDAVADFGSFFTNINVKARYRSVPNKCACDKCIEKRIHNLSLMIVYAQLNIFKYYCRKIQPIIPVNVYKLVDLCCVLCAGTSISYDITTHLVNTYLLGICILDVDKHTECFNTVCLNGDVESAMLLHKIHKIHHESITSNLFINCVRSPYTSARILKLLIIINPTLLTGSILQVWREIICINFNLSKVQFLHRFFGKTANYTDIFDDMIDCSCNVCQPYIKYVYLILLNKKCNIDYRYTFHQFYMRGTLSLCKWWYNVFIHRIGWRTYRQYWTNSAYLKLHNWIDLHDELAANDSYPKFILKCMHQLRHPRTYAEYQAILLC